MCAARCFIPCMHADRVPGARGAHEDPSTSGGNGGGGNGNGNGARRASQPAVGKGRGTETAVSSQHRSYDEEKAAFMDDLLRGGGDTPRDGGGGEESRWLLDRAPLVGAFDQKRTFRVTPLMVRFSSYSPFGSKQHDSHDSLHLEEYACINDPR